MQGKDDMSTDLSPDVLHKIEELATQEKRTPSEIVADALQLYKAQQKKTPGVAFLLSIAGQGQSNQDDVSSRDEEILASEVDPVRGWHVDDVDRGSA
jgi:predicted transcriptional regulator